MHEAKPAKEKKQFELLKQGKPSNTFSRERMKNKSGKFTTSDIYGQSNLAT